MGQLWESFKTWVGDLEHVMSLLAFLAGVAGLILGELGVVPGAAFFRAGGILMLFFSTFWVYHRQRLRDLARERALLERIELIEGGRLLLSPELAFAHMSPPTQSGLGYHRTLTLSVVAPITGPFDMEVLASTNPTRVIAFAHATKDNREPADLKIINRRVHLRFTDTLRPPEKRREVWSKSPLVVFEHDTLISVTLYADEVPEFRETLVMPPAGPPPPTPGS